jgi:2,4-dienoyl-CoA reductase-like NADH-dependent reductase (Old Yellow Enzyme family)
MHLFDPIHIRSLGFSNRIFVSPMCQYSSNDGFANDWHLVHLGSRAVGGAALVFTEASAVLPEGRLSPQDLGIWKNEHIEPLARIAAFIRSQGAFAGMQLAHGGRKASTRRPWEGVGTIPQSQSGWTPVAPSPLPFDENHAPPKALDETEIRVIVEAFAEAAARALRAGFQVLEIHAAHGYLIHEFLSPIANRRNDRYGGSLENRSRLLREIVSAVRTVWPEGLPLFVRISASDWIEGGWDVEQSVELAKTIAPLGVDLIDCSSGGISPAQKIVAEPGFQVPFAERIRREAKILTGAVGLIGVPDHAEAVLREGKADVVLFAREFLRRPYWPLEIASQLGVPMSWPAQYLRVAPPGTPPRDPKPSSDLESFG